MRCFLKRKFYGKNRIFIAKYNDFVRALFKIERGKEEREMLRKISEVSVKALKFMGIPITENVVDLLALWRMVKAE